MVLYGSDYWNEVVDLEPMADWGMIGPDDFKYLTPANTPAEAFAILRDYLTANCLLPATAQEQQAPGLAKTSS